MSDPVTATIIGATVLGGGVAAAGNIKSGNAQYQAGMYQAAISENNAKLAEQQAAESIQQGRVEEMQVRRDAAMLRGNQRATLAALGQVVDEGTAASIVEDTLVQGQVDALTTRRNAQREALGFRIQAQDFRNEAQLNRMGAKSARTAGFYNAGASLLGAAGQAGTQAYQFKQTSFKPKTGTG